MDFTTRISQMPAGDIAVTESWKAAPRRAKQIFGSMTLNLAAHVADEWVVVDG
jgi:hypothetical protein